MFFRSPLGRLLSFLFSVGLAALVYFAFVKGKADDVNKEAGSSDPTRISGGKSLYQGDNFAKALDKLRSKRGAGAEMLKVVIRPADAEFQIKNGEKADGYRYDAQSGDLTAVKVQIFGSGSLEGSQFSLSRVDPGIAAKLAAAVRKKNPAAHATNMALERGLTNRTLAWTVNAEGGGRTGLVYNARPNGSGFTEPGGGALK
jgi:hypothetical protein